MLQIYNYETSDTIIANDTEFGRESYRVADEESGRELRTWISKIEGVSFVDSKTFVSKYTDTPVGLEKLSTGCKTLINILLHPDREVSIEECGDNVLKEILLLDRGKIFCSNPIYFTDKIFDDRKYECHDKRGDVRIVTGLMELGDWYDEQRA